MAQSHVLSALIAKRAEVAGEIESAQGRLAQFRADLIHLDAVIMIFDPTMRPSRIAAKRKRVSKHIDWFAPGELARSVLDALRAAGEPISTADVVERIAARKGIEPGDARALEQIDQAVGDYLRRRRRRSWSGSGAADGACCGGSARKRRPADRGRGGTGWWRRALAGGGG